MATLLFSFLIKNHFPGDHNLRKREEIQQWGRWAAGRRSERHARKCGKGQQFSRMRTKRRSFNYKFFFMVTFCRIKRKYILHRTWEWKGNSSKSYNWIKQLLNSLFLGSIRLCFLSPSGDLGIGLVWDNPTGPTFWSHCWNPLQTELNYLGGVLSCSQDDIRWF